MKPILDCYTSSQVAFESWNLTDFSEKNACLETLADQLPKELSGAFRYQLTHARNVVDQTQSLISPTGETNELYTQGRGVGVVLVDSDSPNNTIAFVAMFSALLTAGNSVIICSKNVWINEFVRDCVSKQLFPDGLVQVVAKESYSELLKLDIRSFVFIGSGTKTAEISTELAMRPSAITSMVAETNLEALPNAKDPMLVLRFVTEKVRSINITAIGGNAMLLEMGNTAH